MNEPIEKLERDLNGFGRILTDVRIEQGQHKTRIDRTESDVKAVWESINEIRSDIKSMNSKMNGIGLKVAYISGGIATTAVILSTIVEYLFK